MLAPSLTVSYGSSITARHRSQAQNGKHTSLDRCSSITCHTSRFSEKGKIHYIRFIMDSFLCFTQLGFCCVYFLFVAETLHTVFDHMEIRLWIVALLLPVILLALVRKVRFITSGSFWTRSCASLNWVSVASTFCL